MKCLACGAEMRLMDVRTDTTAPFGIERRVFQCLSCRQIAQRLRLNRPRMTIAHLPALRPSEAQSERANMVEKVNGGQYVEVRVRHSQPRSPSPTGGRLAWALEPSDPF
jgi:hypothetical protein